jgi:predicted PurR-regulated permease PerM
MNRTWSDYTRRLIGLLLLAVLLLILWVARSVISTLLIAGVIAFLIEPAVRGLHRRARMPRILAAVVVLILLLVLLVLGLAVLAPVLVQQFAQVSFNVTDAVASVLGWLRDTSEWFRDFSFMGLEADLDPYVDDFQERLDPDELDELLPPGEDIFGSAAGLLVTGAGTLAAFTLGLGQLMLSVFLTAIFTLYLVNDSPGMARSIGRLIPESQRSELAELKGEVTRVWLAYFRGQLLLVTLFGLMVGVTMWALGLPSALIVAIISAVMDLVPTVGALVAGGLAVIMALIQGSDHLGVNNFVFAAIVLGSYLGLQQVESSVLQPRIMGRSVELPGLIIIVGVTVGASVAGILGAYLAVPVMATARLVFIYLFRKLTEEQAAAVPAGPGPPALPPPEGESGLAAPPAAARALVPADDHDGHSVQEDDPEQEAHS